VSGGLAIAIPHGPGVPYHYNSNLSPTVGGRFTFWSLPRRAQSRVHMGTWSARSAARCSSRQCELREHHATRA